MTTTVLDVASPRVHFGARPSVPKPMLLMIVFGVFLVIVGVTAAAQTLLVAKHVSNAAIYATVSSDAATVRTFVNGLVTPDDLSGSAPTGHTAMVEHGLQSIANAAEILLVEIRSPDGTIRLSSDATVRGASAPDSTSFAAALQGRVSTTLIHAGESTEGAGLPVASGELIREYFPLVSPDHEVKGVVAMWRDAGPILAAVEKVRNDVLTVIVSGAAVVALLLFLVFRAAQKRITRQTLQLVEATHLDALTGLPNHGAMVGDLATAIEAGRRAGSIISVALMDLDNFRNVNDTHGHDAGDIALLQLAKTLKDSLPPGATIGRYGPDEFLVIARGLEPPELEPYLTTARLALSDQDLAVDSSERLPISMSGAIAAFPADAQSVTELLSVVAVALAAAKISGGGQILVAGDIPAGTDEQRTFDVLQGLVFAVDTKDRYTRRHSEDVSRYASFLARRIGLDDDFIEGITAAGLLHDIGKIAIPDAILRRPGRLTAEEQRIVKEHVTLGESIVRNVPHVDLVRAGIRHHHERWDGRGYVDELAGEEIPLVARILAIADAFSAMTTTRPYRKAMPIATALGRLGDVAGTQLDERLVVAFIDGIETAPDAPMSGEQPLGPGLWVPRTQVA
jgi:diguanylate cyclase (GGDEF)-like protein/putative nucleotidyltransferase with HDIG domain